MRPWERRFIEQLRLDPLAVGDPDGLAVRRWRARLANKGFVGIAPHGAFDRQLLNATLVAQHAAGVLADGIVGPMTWQTVGAMKRQRRPIVRRPGWKPKITDSRPGRNGFPKNEAKRWSTRDPSVIRFKVYHYTGNLLSFLGDARFHVFSDYLDEGGAPAIAYCIGVEANGDVAVFNNPEDITWHCGWNTATLGIVFMGGPEQPNALQKKTLAWLDLALESGTFQPPWESKPWPKIPAQNTVHRRVKPTSCPGDRGEAFVRDMLGNYVSNPRG